MMRHYLEKIDFLDWAAMRQASLLVAMVLFTCGMVFAAAGIDQQVLTGQVVDGEGQPLERVEVGFEARGSTVRTLTDVSGRFEFFDVAPGTYQIVIELSGYERVRKTVTFDSTARLSPTRIVVKRLRFLQMRYRPVGDYLIDVGQFLENFPDEAIDRYKKGLKAKKKGKSQSAIQHLLEAIRLAPTFFAGHLDIGVLYHQSGRLDEAEHEYLLARSLNPHHPQPLVNLGGLYIARGEFNRAIDVLREATAMIPPSPGAFFNLGIALYRTGELVEAEKSLLRAQELDPTTPQIRLMLVNVYLRAGNPNKVLEQANAYLKENPKGEKRTTVEGIRSRTLKQLADLAGS